MTQSDIHVGDVGTRFTVVLTDQNGNVVNLSTATSLQILFEKPTNVFTGESEITKTAFLTTDGTDGSMYYVSEAGFLNVAGRWQMQAVVGFAASQWSSNITNFSVKPGIGNYNYI